MARKDYSSKKELTCEESGNVRLVYLDGVRTFELELSDTVHTRYIAVQLFLIHGVPQAASKPQFRGRLEQECFSKLFLGMNFRHRNLIFQPHIW